MKTLITVTFTSDAATTKFWIPGTTETRSATFEATNVQVEGSEHVAFYNGDRLVRLHRLDSIESIVVIAA